MKHRVALPIVLTALLAFGIVLPAGAETERGRISTNDELVYSFIADTDQQAKITVMWDRSNTDIDVFVFLLDGDDELLVAASAGATDGLESVEVGVIPGEEYLVVLSHFEGPSARFQANVSTTGSENVSKARTFGALGSLEKLAARSGPFAAVAETITRVETLKTSAR
ncbi:MAG: hypothetical protein HC897_04685 [Thermoanaerobaculia bacterium]|nr:hypothetical protein [Thermoanaerobaculia bacterium]